MAKLQDVTGKPNKQECKKGLEEEFNRFMSEVKVAVSVIKSNGVKKIVGGLKEDLDKDSPEFPSLTKRPLAFIKRILLW